MNTAAKTHYDALGAPRTASHAELRRAYVALARRYHPDFHIADPAPAREQAAARMRRINDAWSVLGDDDRRMTYDRSLGGSVPTATASTSGATASATASATGPEPSSGHAPSKWLQIFPAALLAAAFALFAVGFVTGLVGLLAAGLICALLGGAAFIVVPMMTAMRSRNDHHTEVRARA